MNLLRRLFHTRRKAPIIVEGIGAGIAHGAMCGSHHDESFALKITGTDGPEGPETSVVLIVARCEAAELFGTLAAITCHYHGRDSRDTFMDTAHSTYHGARHTLKRLREAGRDCCQAGRLSHGREHTCDQEGTHP